MSFCRIQPEGLGNGHRSRHHSKFKSQQSRFSKAGASPVILSDHADHVRRLPSFPSAAVSRHTLLSGRTAGPSPAEPPRYRGSSFNRFLRPGDALGPVKNEGLHDLASYCMTHVKYSIPHCWAMICCGPVPIYRRSGLICRVIGPYVMSWRSLQQLPVHVAKFTGRDQSAPDPASVEAAVAEGGRSLETGPRGTRNLPRRCSAVSMRPGGR